MTLVSLLSNGKLVPTQLVENLLSLSVSQLSEQPLGPLILVVRAPADDSGQFLTKIISCALRDAPVTSASQRWPATSAFPTLRVTESEPNEADQIELLSELASAPHCIVPLRATSPARQFLLGRASHCELCLSDPSISAEHCEVVIDDGGVRIRDVKSKNGTRLNGHRLTPDELPWLQPMDRLSFGRIEAFACDARALRAVLRQDLRSLL